MFKNEIMCVLNTPEFIIFSSTNCFNVVPQKNRLATKFSPLLYPNGGTNFPHPLANPMLLQDVTLFFNSRHTGSIECANNLSLAYCPKRCSFKLVFLTS